MRNNKTKVVTVFVAVFALLLASLASPVFSAAESSTKVPVLIGYFDDPDDLDVEDIEELGGTIKYVYHLIPAIAASVPESAITELEEDIQVQLVESDMEVHAIDAELDNTWGVKRIGAGVVHNGGNKGLGVKVAIIDSGIDYTHPDLDANYAGGYDFVNNDPDPMDDNGHGTHVAGTVAAEDNDVATSVVGVAPEAGLYALKVLNATGSGSYSDVIAALQWAVDNGMQVTNNSYGSSGNPGPIVKAAFDNAEAAGVLNIGAAGNSGNCFGVGDSVIYPARWDSVVAVAATNIADGVPCFSSSGPDVELAAPGASVTSTLVGGGYGSRAAPPWPLPT